MAFPFLNEETWDDGTLGSFTSETDADVILDFPEYKELAAQGLHPWAGAHALRVRMAGAAVGFITETTDYDISSPAGTISVWFPVLIAEDVFLNDTDTVIMFALESAGPVNETVFGVRRSGADYQLFAGEAGATNTLTITRSNKKWHQIELVATLTPTNTIDFYIDGARVGTQIAGTDMLTIAQASLGAVSGTAAGDRGTLLIGGIIADDVRVFPRERFMQDTKWVTRDVTAWVGPCVLDSASVTGTGTNAVMTILDTDIFEAALTNFSREPVVYIRNVTANDQSPGFNTPVEFKRGVYVQLTGTAPQGWVSVKCGPPVKSSANYVDRGRMAT